MPGQRQRIKPQTGEEGPGGGLGPDPIPNGKPLQHITAPIKGGLLIRPSKMGRGVSISRGSLPPVRGGPPHWESWISASVSFPVVGPIREIAVPILSRFLLRPSHSGAPRLQRGLQSGLVAGFRGGWSRIWDLHRLEIRTSFGNPSQQSCARICWCRLRSFWCPNFPKMACSALDGSQESCLSSAGGGWVAATRGGLRRSLTLAPRGRRCLALAACRRRWRLALPTRRRRRSLALAARRRGGRAFSRGGRRLARSRWGRWGRSLAAGHGRAGALLGCRRGCALSGRWWRRCLCRGCCRYRLGRSCLLGSGCGRGSACGRSVGRGGCLRHQQPRSGLLVHINGRVRLDHHPTRLGCQAHQHP
mmetsp:Transcript_57252/g.152990  ORF Transcript_57252/g.152990 Transcript_57252/m.152990 type:complete len:361 (+) Transcript_57252:219-1301(+)